MAVQAPFEGGESEIRNTGKSRLTRLPQGCVPIRIVGRRSGIGEGGRSSLEGPRLLEESVVGREEDQAFGERAARQGGATSDRSLQHIPVPLFLVWHNLQQHE
jgi:hypothetical protein